ncbi:hypothetical protein NAS92_02340 [Pantoea brenneri]|uniref:hypothetical protein n=1 Tax=Pantoea brenneri TaxID=472694 RepID=UPI00210A69D7|nr:hypothetical protein [Pantoea brenneri]MCQ5469317.1 hypothetical protein [Pantoea brenneri]
MSIIILITEPLEASEGNAEVYSLTAIHAALKLGSSKHPALFEHDSEFHHFNACGRLSSSFEESTGMTHWADSECLEAYSRWLGYESLGHMLDTLPPAE